MSSFSRPTTATDIGVWRRRAHQLVYRLPYRIVVYFSAVAICFGLLAPFYWLFISSISQTAELLASPPHWFPHHPTFERYASLLTRPMAGGVWALSSPILVFRHALINSVIVSCSTTLICLVVGSLSAYAFARLRFKGNRILLFILMMFQMISPITLIIPLYIIMKEIHLINTLVALVFLNTSFSLVYVVWSMTTYFKSVPIDLEEAAQIDGCPPLGILTKIMLPLALPGLVGSGTLVFLLSWNDFMFALTFATGIASKTVPVVLAEFSAQYQVDYGMMMTGAVLASITPAIFALSFQRFLIRGLTAGAVKG